MGRQTTTIQERAIGASQVSDVYQNILADDLDMLAGDALFFRAIDI